jgi:hypothetical protein
MQKNYLIQITETNIKTDSRTYLDVPLNYDQSGWLFSTDCKIASSVLVGKNKLRKPLNSLDLVTLFNYTEYVAFRPVVGRNDRGLFKAFCI